MSERREGEEAAVASSSGKNNADFRSYIRKKEDGERRDDGDGDAKRNADDTNNNNRGRWRRDAAQNAFQKKKNKNKNKTRESAEDEEETPKYRDRARERREGAKEEDGGEERRDREYDGGEYERGVFDRLDEDEEDEEKEYAAAGTTKSRRLMDIEKSKYMGGDEKTTHKVKGLDFALLRKKREELEMKKGKNDDDSGGEEDDEALAMEEADGDDAQNTLPSLAEFSSLYAAKSNLGRSLVFKIETAQKRHKDALTKRTKIPPLSGVSYVYNVNSRTRELTRTIEMETKPRADIEEERKARRREFAKISKDEEKMLRAVAKAIREAPRGLKEEEKTDCDKAAASKDANAEGTSNAADSDSEDIFADVGKDYDAIAELKKEEEQKGEKETTTTKKEARKVLFDGEALEAFETGPRKADENIKKMDEAYERKRLEEAAEMADDAYGEYYPGFDAGFGGEIDDDDDDKDKDREAGDEGGNKKGRKGKKELTEAQKIKQKENEEYQAMQKHMKEKYSDKYDSAFGVAPEKKNKKEKNEEEEEKEGAAGKRAKRLKI
jgi:hypothetical protein